MERYKPLLKKLRKYRAEIEERINELTHALLSDPDLERFTQEQKQEFVYSQAKELIERLERPFSISTSSIINAYLPPKNDKVYYSWVKGKFYQKVDVHYKEPKKFEIHSEFDTEDFYREFESCLDAISSSLGYEGNAFLIVHGKTFTKKISQKIIKNLRRKKFIEEEVENPTPEAAARVRAREEREKLLLLGIGGGTPLDVAKLVGGDTNQPVIEVPSQDSHDGIRSDRVTLTRQRMYSLRSKQPYAVILPWDILYNQPPASVAKGFGDGIAKITSTRDWRLREEYGDKYEWIKDPHYNREIAERTRDKALGLVKMVNKLREGGPFDKFNPSWREGIEKLTDTLLYFGNTMAQVGSSVPCSGSEHLFAHGWNGSKDHGYKVSLGQRLALKLYEEYLPSPLLDLKSNELRSIQEYLRIPLKVTEVGRTREEAIKGVIKGAKIGVERGRYTILSYLCKELKLTIDKNFAEEHLSYVDLI